MEGMGMKITSEISLRNFEGWSGAVYTLDTLTDEQKDALETNLEELYQDGMDETSLNDLLWFERDSIAEWLGFEDWEDLERKNSGEDEEEDDEEDNMENIKKYNNIRGFIRDYEDKHPRSPFFSRETLAFFGERLSELRILKDVATVKRYSGELCDCYVVSSLQRKAPGGPRRTYHYFAVDTLEHVIPER